MAKKRIRIPQVLRASLQKEINSECPFCPNYEVETFEIHHIDSDPANNEFWNLIMLCSSCHTKIEKCLIPKPEVEKKKNQLALKSAKMELVSIVVDSKNCSWSVSEVNEFAFHDAISKKSPFPLLNFTFVNHTLKTIVLKTIKVKADFLPRGLSGTPSEPGILKPISKFHIQLSYKKKGNTVHLDTPVFVPSQHPVLFQLEFSEGNNPGDFFQIEGRIILDIEFLFNDSITVKSPRIFFNCETAERGFKLMLLS